MPRWVRNKIKKNQNIFDVCHTSYQCGDNNISHTWYLTKATVIDGEFIGRSPLPIQSDTLGGLRKYILQMLLAIDEFQRKENLKI